MFLSVLTGERPLTDADIQVKIEATETLSANFGQDYAEAGTAAFAKFALVWREVMKRGLSKSEFEVMLASLITRCKYPTWTLADFFETERPELHSAAWKNNLIHSGKNAESDFDAYKVDGVVLWCYSPDKPYALALIVRRGVSQIGHSNGGEKIDPVTKGRTVFALMEKAKPTEKTTLQEMYVAQGKKNLDLIAEINVLKNENSALKTERELHLRRIAILEKVRDETEAV